MEIKLNNKIGFLFILSIKSFLLLGQGNYNTISINDFSINELKYGDGIDKCKATFGKPSKYSEFLQEDGDGPEGYGTVFYIDYDSISITYVEFYKKIILSNVSLSGKKYKVGLGNFSIKVGDKLSLLEEYYPESFAYFRQQHPLPYKKDEQEFYLNIEIKHPDYTYFGLVNIKLQNDAITKIMFRFDEGT
jgi:hypothetical protein